MFKHDLAARPIYHRKRESIEAHLTLSPLEVFGRRDDHKIIRCRPGLDTATRHPRLPSILLRSRPHAER
jgi:hypothetical protein